MMTFFDHGVVLKTKIEMWIDNASTNAQLITVSLKDNNSITSPTTKAMLEYNPQMMLMTPTSPVSDHSPSDSTR